MKRRVGEKKGTNEASLLKDVSKFLQQVWKADGLAYRQRRPKSGRVSSNGTTAKLPILSSPIVPSYAANGQGGHAGQWPQLSILQIQMAHTRKSKIWHLIYKTKQITL